MPLAPPPGDETDTTSIPDQQDAFSRQAYFHIQNTALTADQKSQLWQKTFDASQTPDTYNALMSSMGVDDTHKKLLSSLMFQGPQINRAVTVLSPGPSAVAKQAFAGDVFSRAKDLIVPVRQPPPAAAVPDTRVPTPAAITPVPTPAPDASAVPGLLTKGNIHDLYTRPVLKNPDGSTSTTSSMSFQDDYGKEVLIPTVVDGKRLSNDDAIAHYQKTGQHLGIFDTPDQADAYAESLHESQQAMLFPSGKPRVPPPAEAGTLNKLDELPYALARTFSDLTHPIGAEKTTGQTALDALGATANQVGGIIQMLSMNRIDIANGVLRAPVTGNIQRPLAGFADPTAPGGTRGLPEYLQRLGVSPDIATEGNAAAIGNFIGGILLWTEISRVMTGALDVAKATFFGKATQALATTVPLAEDAMRVVQQAAPRNILTIAQDILKNAGIQAATGATFRILEAAPKGGSPGATLGDKAKDVGKTALYAAGLSAIADTVLSIPEAVHTDQAGRAYQAAEKLRDALSDLLYKTGKYKDTATAQGAAEDILSNYATKNGGVPSREWSENITDVIKNKTLTQEGINKAKAAEATTKVTPPAGSGGIETPEGPLTPPPVDETVSPEIQKTVEPGATPQVTSVQGGKIMEAKPMDPAQVQNAPDVNAPFRNPPPKVIPETPTHADHLAAAVTEQQDRWTSIAADEKKLEDLSGTAEKTEAQQSKIDALSESIKADKDTYKRAWDEMKVFGEKTVAEARLQIEGPPQKEVIGETPASKPAQKAIDLGQKAVKPLTPPPDDFKLTSPPGTTDLPVVQQFKNAVEDHFKDRTNPEVKLYARMLADHVADDLATNETDKYGVDESIEKFRPITRLTSDSINTIENRVSEMWDEAHESAKNLDANIKEVDSKFASLIEDPAARNTLVRKITRADQPFPETEQNYDAHPYKGIGPIVHEIASYISEHVTHDPKETNFVISAKGGTREDPAVQLRLSAPKGKEPSAATIAETQRWLNHLFPEDTPQMPSVAPKITDTTGISKNQIKNAQTGISFEATLMRGQGRSDSPYNPMGAQLPILGENALYTTDDKEYANHFGPNITTHAVSIKNPLVITNDVEWRALTSRAGWKYPNPFGAHLDSVANDVRSLRALVEADGHDGVIVRIPSLKYGDQGKTLSNVFGADQAIQFTNTTTKELASPPSGSYSVRQNAAGMFEVVNPQGGVLPRTPSATREEAQAIADKKQATYEQMTGSAKAAVTPKVGARTKPPGLKVSDELPDRYTVTETADKDGRFGVLDTLEGGKQVAILPFQNSAKKFAREANEIYRKDPTEGGTRQGPPAAHPLPHRGSLLPNQPVSRTDEIKKELSAKPTESAKDNLIKQLLNRTPDHIDTGAIDDFISEMKVFHGSPHQFGEFSLQKIGTGEGAQAYGWGLYFAGRKSVAEYYRDRLSANRYDHASTISSIGGTSMEAWYESYQESTGDLYSENTDVYHFFEFVGIEIGLSAIQTDALHALGSNGSIQGTIQELRRLGDVKGADSQYHKLASALVEMSLDGTINMVNEGRLYKVEAPEDFKYLDWDKPLSKQDAHVVTILKDVGYYLPTATGEETYTGMVYAAKRGAGPYGELKTKIEAEEGHQISPEEAVSRWLGSKGIPGIKYADAVSRGKKGGTSNYVIFDDKLIKILESGPTVSEMRTGEGKAAAGMDPRIMKVLGGNLYSGDLGAVALREMLQNALDSVRELSTLESKDGRITIAVDTSAKTISIADNGKGMLPDTATKELLDIGGSKKEEGSSGGFGIAKVAIFANAADIDITTTARNKDGEIWSTHLRGSGEDWMDQATGLDVSHRQQANDTPTGTEIRITMNESASMGSSTVESLGRNILKSWQFPYQINISVDGAILTVPSETFRVIHSFDVEGASVELSIGDLENQVDYGSVYAMVLNRGLFQFGTSVGNVAGETAEERQITLPGKLLLNIKPTGTPEEPDYPFSPDRERIRTYQITSNAERYVSDHVIPDAQRQNILALLAKYRIQIDRGALYAVGKGNFRVIDTEGAFPDALMKELQARPYMGQIADSANRHMQKLVEAINRVRGLRSTKIDAPTFAIGLGGGWIGLNVKGSSVGEEQNLLLLNPYTILREIANHIAIGSYPESMGPERMAARIMSTLIHELAHQKQRIHDALMVGEQTRIIDETYKAMAGGVQALQKILEADGAAAYNAIYEDLLKLQPEWGGVDIYRQVSTSAAVEGEPPSPEGDTDRSQEQGTGSGEAVPAGGHGAPQSLAGSSAIPQSDADIDDLDDETATKILKLGAWTYQEHPDWPEWSKAMMVVGAWVEPYLPTAFDMIDNVAAATGKKPAAVQTQQPKGELHAPSTQPRGPPPAASRPGPPAGDSGSAGEQQTTETGSGAATGGVGNRPDSGSSTDGEPVSGEPAAGSAEGVRGQRDPLGHEPGVSVRPDAQPGIKGPVKRPDVARGSTGRRYSLVGKPPVELTRSQRLAINDEAIALTRTKKPGDPLTDAEKDILRQYTGRGGLNAADEGVLFEHYTSYRMTGWHWEKVKQLGFPLEGARGLEPAGGGGNYIGFAPASVRMEAVEVDETAYKVMRLLYPESKISHMPFEDYIPKALFDFIISNFPFHQSRGALRYSKDAEAYKEIETLHDLFFVKGLDLIRPNGLLTAITSTGTMDKMGTKIRQRINEQAEFLGSYRTPAGEFNKNTQYGGSVDVIFLRKRTPEEIETIRMLSLPESPVKPDQFLQREWLNAVKTTAFNRKDTGVEANLSTYYIAHPGQAWGKLEAGYGVRQETRVGVRPTAPIDAFIALSLTPEDPIKYVPVETSAVVQPIEEPVEPIGEARPGMKAGSLTITESGDIAYAGRDRMLYPATFGASANNPAAMQRITSGIRLMDDTESLYAALRENQIVRADALRTTLKQQLDAYQRKYLRMPGNDTTLWRYLNGGPIKNPYPFADPRVWMLAGLTDDKGTLSAVFTENTIYVAPKVPRSFDSSSLTDTANFVYEETGRFDAEDVAHLFKGATITAQDVGLQLAGLPGFSIESLTPAGIPSVLPDIEYLYGPIWEKLDDTEEMRDQVEANPEVYPENIKTALAQQEQRLMEALPEQATVDTLPKLDPFATWVDDNTVSHWMQSFGMNGVKVYQESNGRWMWMVGGRPLDFNGQSYDDEAVAQYLNHERLRKSVPTGELNAKGKMKMRSVFDLEAQKQLNKLSEHFTAWAGANKNQIAHLVPVYNRGFRSFRRRTFSEEQLKVNGLSATFKGKPTVVNPHQWQWTAQALHLQSGFNAQGVGSGKTLAAILLGKIGKERGIFKKLAIVVPAKVIKNWGFEINQAFPEATIIDLGGLSAENMNKMLHRVATSNSDFVLITIEGMKAIPLRASEQYMEEDLAEFEVRIRKAQDSGDKRLEARLQDRLRNKREKLAAIQDMKKTNAIFWEDTGIDALILDEAHAYKNAPTDMADMGQWMHESQYSQQASDMIYKTRYTHEQRVGRQGQNVWGLTATPTPNHPVEIYSMMKYVAPGEWTSRGMLNAGDFIEQFGVVGAWNEFSTTGVSKTRTGFIAFKNLIDLRAIVSRYFDMRATSELQLEVPTAQYIDHKIDPSPDVMYLAGQIAELQAYVDKSPRMAALDGINPLTVLTLARKLAADIAILDPLHYARTVGRPGSKMADLIDTVLRNDDGVSTQLVFLDLYRAMVEVVVGSEEEKIAMRFVAGLEILESEKGHLDVQDDADDLTDGADGEDTEANDDEDTDIAAAQPQQVRDPHAKATKQKTRKIEIVNLHNFIKKKLMENGIPESQIAIVNQGSNQTAAQKFKVQQMNAQGKIRFLIGTTKSMGEGMNLQTNSTDVHHYDVPWNPAALEQREGRVVRQGNLQTTVRVHKYVGRGTSDAKMYAILARKAAWIRELWMGTSDTMTNFETDGNNFADLAADAAITQDILDFWLAVRRLKNVIPQIEAAEEAARAQQEKINDIDQDIAHRQSRIDLLNQKIAAGDANSFDRQRLEDHTKNIAIQEASKAKRQSDLDMMNANLETLKSGFFRDRAALADQLNRASMDGRPVYEDHQKLLAASNKYVPGQTLMKEQADQIRGNVTPPRFRSTSSDIVGTEGRKRIAESIGDVPPPIGATITRVGPPVAEKPAEQTPRFQSTSPQVAERIAAANIITPSLSPTQRWLQTAKDSIHAFTRKFIRMPEGAKFGPMIDMLTHLEHQVSVQQQLAKWRIESWELGLNENQLANLRLAIVKLNAYANFITRFDVSDEELLPFGWTREILINDKAAVDAMLADDPAVARAIALRKANYAEVIENEARAVENLPGGASIAKRMREEWFADYHTQRVLTHMADSGKNYTGAAMKPLPKRGFMMGRSVHAMDYSTNIHEADWLVLSQMGYDTETAIMLNKTDAMYSALRDLKRQAFAANESAMLDTYIDMGMNPEEAQAKYRAFGRRQARALDELGKAAVEGTLPDTASASGSVDDFDNGTFTKGGRFAAVIQSLADNFQANMELQDELGDEWTSDDRQLLTSEEMKGVMQYMSWLVGRDEFPTSGLAKLFYKGVQEKRTAIKETLGKNYVEWQDLIPKGHVAWPSHPQTAFYTAYTLEEQSVAALFDKTLTDQLADIGIRQDDLRRILAVGNRVAQMVIPEEIAYTLDHLKPQTSLPPGLSQISRTMWNLHSVVFRNPFMLVPLQLRASSREFQRLAMFMTPAIKQIPSALADIWPMIMKNKPPEGDTLEWFLRGGMHSLLMIQELGDVNAIPQFIDADAKHMRINDEGDWEIDTSISAAAMRKLREAWRVWLSGTNKATGLREAAFRLAAFKEAKAQMLRNPDGRPDTFGASDPAAVMALSDINDRAYKLSNEVTGAYDKISAAGKVLRYPLLAFWSLQETTFSVWKQGALNAINGQELPSLVAEKIWPRYFRLAPKAAVRAARLVLKYWLLFGLLLLAWNRVGVRLLNGGDDPDTDIPEYDRDHTHITLGRNKDGSARYITNLGDLDNILSWVGGDHISPLMRDLAMHVMGPAELPLYVAKSAINKTIGLVHPGLKAVVEAYTGRNYFPDASNSRPIHDGWNQFFSNFGVAGIYRYLSKKPGAPEDSSELFMGVKSAPIMEADYDTIRGIKFKEMLRLGKSTSSGSDDAKSEALREWKTAERDGDQATAATYLHLYALAGGDQRGLEESIQRLDPLFGLTPDEQDALVSRMDNPTKLKLTRSYLFYARVFGGKPPARWRP